MAGTTTSLKTSKMGPRRRSRSEGCTNAAEELQASLARFSMTELYVRTSDGVVFQDEEFQREIVAKAERLVETALSPESSERNALIAKKALKYREMRSRRPNGATRSPVVPLRMQSCPISTGP
ncbi:hypothetical protein L917_00172 [Phytophthora nicotianae]|uniref:Uncharacterized protein n=2 Tax=Phytophthora nicotianae TaxID=4792 RepID=V9G2Q2_PHYNI|nr:hypothetical protein F443_00219 [Phytophthora nicotianae P1569]ETM03624.1 hypothetical protein L917_00172 [Phytophthora nicotianae]ETM56899.1 hypothetical protein L914_00191 [Phytophthora nicotianae]